VRVQAGCQGMGAVRGSMIVSVRVRLRLCVGEGQGVLCLCCGLVWVFFARGARCWDFGRLRCRGGLAWHRVRWR
jgi:hypothetical protein